MDALLLVLVSGACLLLAYLTYARWLSRRVFALRDDAVTPASELEDNADYVPTKKSIVFGHHFTSIAGTGPIVGPAIAVMWGWLPAILWVVIGSIFVGAVHDLGSLVVSLRSKGRSIGDIAGDLLGPRARFIFLLILIMGLWIVLAIFGLVVAAVLRQYPSAIFPVVIQIPIAVVIGLLIHRKGRSIVIPSIVALAVMYASVIWGDVGVLHMFNQTMSALPTWAWVAGLLAYAYIASVLPVWTLLQPRDYINALQLITSLGVLVVGLLVAATLGGTPDSGADAMRPELSIVAPMVDWQPIGAPPMIPVLFITIACGACSGFHCLVGSGTTSKQLQRESDATAVGYGSMVTEGFLATLVIVACVAGLGLGGVPNGEAVFASKYASWQEAGSLGAKVGAFVEGAANLIASTGVPHPIGLALMGVLVASFAGTTMDTACRLQRYVVQELSRAFLPKRSTTDCATCGHDISAHMSDGEHDDRQSPHHCPACGEPFHPSHAAEGVDVDRASFINPFRWLVTMHGATAFAILSAFALAMFPAPGQPFTLESAGTGGLILWPLFGATNQLLGGFAFIVITSWLIVMRKPVWFIALPLVFMLAVPAGAMTWQAFIGNENNPSWVAQSNWLLVVIACVTLALETWLVVETLVHWTRRRPFDALRDGMMRDA